MIRASMPKPSENDVEMIERKGYWEARYLGAFTMARYKKQMEQSVRACEEKKATHLLIDLRAMTGFTPSTQERYELGRYGAEIGKKLARVSVVGTAEQIDPEQFATMVARNRGLQIRAFTDADAAVEWLLKG
jgi:hypothetical protein